MFRPSSHASGSGPLAFPPLRLYPHPLLEIDPMPIHPLDVILHKRDGHTLSDAEIQAVVDAIVAKPGCETITEAQIAALLMAVFFRGLDTAELAALTRAMRHSGEVADLRPLGTVTVDKHSTGGVGDKTSLLLAPILAAAGLQHPTATGVPGICVPMISGRSLGHTGGTLDKLETIPGFNTQLSLDEFSATLRRCGAAMIGQTPRLVPADRILYALRDHTGTVESPYLITASIMSKKLAEDLDALVLDVKTGSGAFMKSEEDARHLARLMVETGEASGTRTVALLTGMDEPLGRFAGNWLEVRECVDILQGRRHALSQDLIALTNTLAGWMLHLAGRAESPEAGYLLSNHLMATGAAYRAWLGMVEAQGGATDVFNDPASVHVAKASRILYAGRSGYLASIDCTEAGWAVQRLGAGRARPGGPVSASAGIEVHVKLGSKVSEGQPLVTLYAEDESLLNEPNAMLAACYRIEPAAPERKPVIRELIRKTA